MIKYLFYTLGLITNSVRFSNVLAHCFKEFLQLEMFTPEQLSLVVVAVYVTNHT